MKIRQPSSPLCVGKGVNKIVTDKKVGSSFYLYPSYRISFILKLKSAPSSYDSVFSITDALYDSKNNKHPQMIFEKNASITKIRIFSNRCNGYIDSFETMSDIYYNYNLSLNKNYAITLEYVREINQQLFYINGILQKPYAKSYSRTFPGANCYGIYGQLLISDKHYNNSADGTVQNFVYEENVSGRPLGGFQIREIETHCQ